MARLETREWELADMRETEDYLSLPLLLWPSGFPIRRLPSVLMAKTNGQSEVGRLWEKICIITGNVL